MFRQRIDLNSQYWQINKTGVCRAVEKSRCMRSKKPCFRGFPEKGNERYSPQKRCV
jgi:hypothetical protein